MRMQKIGIVLFSIAAAACGKAGAGAAPAAPSGPCPRAYHDFPDAANGEKSCTCAANEAAGSVWGVDLYTQDSSPCAAAVHAGLITRAAGGAIRVMPAAGCASYDGSSRNGVTTSSWGSFPSSFYFPEKGAAPACKSAAPVAACPTSFHAVPGLSPTTEITCSCAASATGSVWGSGVYTQDSSICAAARHAGAVGAAGGNVTAKASAGCAAYKGSSANGVTASDWGSFGASFYFPGKGDGACPAATAAAPPAACPGSFHDVPGLSPTTEITCSCPASAAGSVWGSGVYTQDSSICAAARHAGAIDAAGGLVTAKASAGCDSYKGGSQNGVAASDWGAFGASFYFPSKGDGKCAAASSGPCPGSFHDIAGLSATTEITCDCAAAGMVGSVWGSGPYTQDSSICKAAVHAGLIPATGGRVTAKAGPGCKSFAGGTEGGVTTAAWGSYPSSFDFPAKGARACPQ